jgi:hypothetical protein
MSRIKKFFGIEGVKVSFSEETTINLKENKVSGELVIKSKAPSIITSIDFKVIEQYQRGSKEELRSSEFVLFHKTIFPKNLTVTQEKSLEIPFNYKILSNKSEMDLLEERHKILSPFIGIAKKLYSVKSTYLITATLQIEGSGIQPFTKKVLIPIK